MVVHPAAEGDDSRAGGQRADPDCVAVRGDGARYVSPCRRIQRDAADALFTTVRTEVERDPDDWRRWYRLARAYDYAGDRRRAREAMKTAVELQAGR